MADLATTSLSPDRIGEPFDRLQVTTAKGAGAGRRAGCSGICVDHKRAADGCGRHILLRRAAPDSRRHRFRGLSAQRPAQVRGLARPLSGQHRHLAGVAAAPSFGRLCPFGIKPRFHGRAGIGCGPHGHHRSACAVRNSGAGRLDQARRRSMGGRDRHLAASPDEADFRRHPADAIAGMARASPPLPLRAGVGVPVAMAPALPRHAVRSGRALSQPRAHVPEIAARRRHRTSGAGGCGTGAQRHAGLRSRRAAHQKHGRQRGAQRPGPEAEPQAR